MEAKCVASQRIGAREGSVYRLEVTSGPDVYFVILKDTSIGDSSTRHLFCQGGGLKALGQGVEWANKFVEREAL
jgi:hypothetical protein